MPDNYSGTCMHIRNQRIRGGGGGGLYNSRHNYVLSKLMIFFVLRISHGRVNFV